METKFIIDIYLRLEHLMNLATEMNECKANPDWVGGVYHAASDYAKELLEWPECEIYDALKGVISKEEIACMLKCCKELVEQHTHED